MKRNGYLTSILVACILVFCALFAVSCSDADDNTQINSVEIASSKESIVVKATLSGEYRESNPKGRIYLIALPTADTDGTLAGGIEVGDSRLKGKITFKVPLYSEDGDSRLTYSFVLAEKADDEYIPISPAAYVSNPSALGSTSIDAARVSGIKALSDDDVFGAEMLGAHRLMLEARIDQFILPSHCEGAIRFNHDGITYFFDAEKVSELDARILDASKLDMRVYLRTTLSYPEKDSEREPIDALYCDGAKKAEGYLVNTKNAEAVDMIEAFYSFISSRYSGEYGSVCDYIIGSSVNNYYTHCNAGSLEREEFEALYLSWFRIAYNTIRSHNAGATVYLPVSREWRTDTDGKIIGAKVFLSRFAESARATGDFDYAISLDLGHGEDMPEVLSGDDTVRSELGINNLSEFSDLMDDEELRYKGDKRTYIIDSLALSPSLSQKNKAAYYTYAYYTAASLGFDAIFYNADKASIYTDEGERADLYYAMLMCGSNVNSQLSDYTEKLANSYIPTFSDYVSRTLIYQQKPVMEVSESVLKNKKPFPISPDSFVTSLALTNSSISKDGDGGKIWLIETDGSPITASVSYPDVSADSIKEAGYIGITLSSKTAPTIALVLSEKSNGGTVISYIGEAKTANGEATYFFNITDFSKKIDSSSDIDISLCILQSDGEESLEIRDISLYGSSGSGGNTAITVIVVALILAAFIGLIVLLALKRKKHHTRRDSDED